MYSMKHFYIMWVLPQLHKHLGVPLDSAGIDPIAAATKFAKKWVAAAPSSHSQLTSPAPHSQLTSLRPLLIHG